MSQPSIHDPLPWTPEEDAVLREHWANPDMDYTAISEVLPRQRTVGAIQHRGHKIGLGRKARHKKPRRSSKKLKAWPKDMPKFEDHPEASKPGSWSRAAVLGSRIRSASSGNDASYAGSTLAGASLNPTGRRVG